MQYKPQILYAPNLPAGEDPPTSPPAPALAPPPPTELPGPVPYERFKEVNEQLKTLQAQMLKVEAEQKKAKEKELADTQQWKTLAEQREAELKAERLARLRLETAGKKGIPVDLVDRLRGETAEEMEADAESLLAFLKPKEGPGVPPPGSKGAPAVLDFSKMTPEEIRKAAKGKPINQLVR